MSIASCPGRSAARSDALQTRDRCTHRTSPARTSTECLAVPDQRRTASQELRAAPHPGHEVGTCRPRTQIQRSSL